MALKFVTRERIKVDRVACPWLIKSFILQFPIYDALYLYCKQKARGSK